MNVRRAARLLEPRVLRAHARVVEPRADGVSLGDLPAIVAQHVALRAVQDADATRRQRRRVLAARDTRPRRLDAVESDRVVGHEPAKEPYCVGPAAHARDRRVRQGARRLQDLRARLLPDDALEARDQIRVGVRACGAPDAVIRGAHVGDPVAERLVHGVLQRARARVDRDDLRAEELHAPHVGSLARHVLRAHVDLARQVEERARRRRRDAVLARARLRDDAALAHLLREERLAERVVDLVRARVTEVLPLEEEPGEHLARGVDRVREPLCFGEGRRPPDVALEQPAPLLVERRALHDRLDGHRELFERRHERLGDESPAKGSVVSRL